MKTSFMLFAFVVLLFSCFIWKEKPIRNFAIGNYHYDIALQKQYAHDDDAYNTYFVVTQANSRKTLCSATLLSLRADTVLSKGSYLITSKNLQFKERYFGPRKIRGFVFADSIRKTFYPDRNGGLHLTEVVEYKSGKVTTTRH
ncbi:hypothetical protein [Hymenobacter glaciei]|uniref:hypothetical protein n=1 Tax=Hymenobacter glaciei TaxID=877209 RepID=UPI0031F0B092